MATAQLKTVGDLRKLIDQVRDDTPLAASPIALDLEMALRRGLPTTWPFTTAQTYGLNDAVDEVVHRMIDQGQTPAEIKLASLSNLFGLMKEIDRKIGTVASKKPTLQTQAPAIIDAIKKPKVLKA